MPKILLLGEQPQFRTLLTESLWLEGHLVESVGDATMLWEHLGDSQPDLAVMVCQGRNYGDVERIKRAVTDAGPEPAVPD